MIDKQLQRDIVTLIMMLRLSYAYKNERVNEYIEDLFERYSIGEDEILLK